MSTTNLITIVLILKKTDDVEDKMIKILYQLKPGEGEHLSNALEILPWEDHACITLIFIPYMQKTCDVAEKAILATKKNCGKSA